MKIALYTTNFGNFNKQHYDIPPQKTEHIYKKFYLTDNEQLMITPPSTGWNYVYCPIPRQDIHPRLRAKFFKLQPWELDCLVDFDVWIYLDSCVNVVSNNFIEFILNCLGSNDIALTPHQFRQSILQECIACLSAQKHGGRFREETLLATQVNYYNRHKEVRGLWWCGIFAWQNNQITKNLGQSWFKECIKWTARDQLSLPYLLQKLPKVTIGELTWKQLHELTMSTDYFHWCPEY